MSGNLQDKFDAFQQQVQDQHDALMARLADTNAKLDAIATALGAPPPTATTTLADVVAAIEASNLILQAVKQDTAAIDGKVLDVFTEVDDIHADTISMDQKLLRIRDAINPLDEALPVEAKSSIPWLLFRIMDAINPTWPRPTSVPLQPAVDLLLELLQPVVPDIALMQDALGLVPGDATTTVLGRLAALNTLGVNQLTSIGISGGPDDTVLKLLAKNADCACGGLGPPSGSCDNPFVSTGMWLGPFGAIGGSNVIVATWSEPLPTGISFGTFFSLGTDDGELQNSDWSGWKVYVSSTEPQYADSPSSLTRYPTNQWRDLPAGAASYSWAVSDRGSIQVTLCSPIPLENCQQVTVTGNFADQITAQFTITGESRVRWVSGGTPIGIYLDLTTGSAVVPPAWGTLFGPGQTGVIPGPYPRTIGFSVGQTNQAVIVEVCALLS